MGESFGARMRRCREQQQIALCTIAEQTKIKQSLLEAMERDDVSRWPAGIFRRAFIRAYAHAIGLDPDIVVRKFLELYPDPIEAAPAAETIASVVESARAGVGPRAMLRDLVASTLESLSRAARASAGDPRQLADMPAPVSAGMRAAGPSEPPMAVEPSPEPVRTAAAPEPAMTLEASPEPVTTAAAPEPELPVAMPEPVTTAAALEPEPPVASPDPVATEVVIEVATEPVTPADPPEPMTAAAPPDIDFVAVARLCTHLGRADEPGAVAPLLREAARILDAAGLIVWVWDSHTAALRPVLSHGYSERLLAQLPAVALGDNNPTAAAFRSEMACAVPGSARASGAMVLPLMTPSGCVGVLAIEMRCGSAPTETVLAAATIVAAQLATWLGAFVTADANIAERRLA